MEKTLTDPITGKQVAVSIVVGQHHIEIAAGPPGTNPQAPETSYGQMLVDVHDGELNLAIWNSIDYDGDPTYIHKVTLTK